MQIFLLVLFLAFLITPGPDHIIIESISLSQPVYPVGQKDLGNNQLIWETLDNDVGWHKYSAVPGEGSNIVLNGHSNIYSRVFRNLTQVKVGDKISLFDNSKEYKYIVHKRIIILEKGLPWQKRMENARIILPTEDERLTLVTCLNGNKYRLIIVALGEGEKGE